MAGDGRESVRRLLTEVWGRGNVSLLPELVTDDVVVHFASDPEPVVGIESYRAFVAAYVGVLGEARFDIEDELVDGDRVATRWRAHLPGDATGRGILGIHMVRCAEDGRISESWGTFDMLSVTAAASQPAALEKLTLGL